MKLARHATFVACAVLAVAGCKRGASVGGAIPLVPADVAWTLPHMQRTWHTAADGTVTDAPGSTVLKIEGNLVKNKQGGVELVVEPDGKVYSGHHLEAKNADKPDAFLGGTFASDDSLAIHAFATTVRVLDGGQVVAEDTRGGNQRPLPARVDPYTPAVRREALIEVFWWASLDRELSSQLAPAKTGAVAPSASAATAHVENSAIVGTWAGVLDQQPAGRSPSYPAELTFGATTSGTSRYTSLNCGGTLSGGPSGDGFTFHESITSGRATNGSGGCIDGDVELLVTGDTMSVKWKGSSHGNPVLAAGTLHRVAKGK